MTQAKPTYCKCGCGREIIKDHTTRRRMWHTDCKEKYLDHLKQLARVAAAKQEVKRKLNRQTPTNTGLDPVERRLPMCSACCNLSDRRPIEGCPPRTMSAKGKLLTCGLPYSRV